MLCEERNVGYSRLLFDSDLIIYTAQLLGWNGSKCHSCNSARNIDFKKMGFCVKHKTE